MLPQTLTHVLALKSATGTLPGSWAAPSNSQRLPTAMQASTSTQAAAHAHLIGHHVPQPITGQKQEVVLISACDHRYLSREKRTHAVPMRHTIAPLRSSRHARQANTMLVLPNMFPTAHPTSCSCLATQIHTCLWVRNDVWPQPMVPNGA